MEAPNPDLVPPASRGRPETTGLRLKHRQRRLGHLWGRPSEQRREFRSACYRAGGSSTDPIRGSSRLRARPGGYLLPEDPHGPVQSWPPRQAVPARATGHPREGGPQGVVFVASRGHRSVSHRLVSPQTHSCSVLPPWRGPVPQWENQEIRVQIPRGFSRRQEAGRARGAGLRRCASAVGVVGTVMEQT